MQKITNKDIADRAGVSPAAVSIAIHGKKGISAETRARILRVVDELQYCPPTGVQSAACAHTIILVLDALTDRVTPALLQSLMECAARNEAELRFYTLTQVMDEFPARLVNCILLLTFDEIGRAALDRLSSYLPAIMIIDGDYSREPFHNIRADYAGAAYALMRYMTGLGHRNFVYINQDLSPNKNLLTFSGFQRWSLEMHLPLNPEQIMMDTNSDPHIWSHLADIVRAGNISAVVCTSDDAAVAAVNRLIGAGLRVPEDVSVAMICTDAAPRHPTFDFTHVSLNLEKIGIEIREFLSRADFAGGSCNILVPPSPVVQGSSTAAPKYDPTTKKLAIALILKEHPTYRVVRAGFLTNVRQMGYQAEVVGIADTDEDAFRQVCMTLPKLAVDGVVLWLPLPDLAQKFRDLGIPVVCPHSFCGDGAEYGVRANIAASPEQTAKNVAEFFAARLKGKKGVIAVSQTADTEQEAAVTREVVRLMAIRCPSIRVQSDLRFVNHTEENTQLVMRYIENTPDLLGAFTTAGAACITWAAAKKALGRDDMIIVGTDYTDETLDLLERGEVQAFVAQPIYEEAKTSVVALDRILRGNPFPYFTPLNAPLVTKQTMEPYRRLLQEVNNWYA